MMHCATTAAKLSLEKGMLGNRRETGPGITRGS